MPSTSPPQSLSPTDPSFYYSSIPTAATTPHSLFSKPKPQQSDFPAQPHCRTPLPNPARFSSTPQPTSSTILLPFPQSQPSITPLLLLLHSPAAEPIAKAPLLLQQQHHTTNPPPPFVLFLHYNSCKPWISYSPALLLSLYSQPAKHHNSSHHFLFPTPATPQLQHTIFSQTSSALRPSLHH